MNLTQFCKNLFKEDGFVLVDAYTTEHIIGNPKKKIPIKLRLLDKSLHYKLLLLPELYFGEAYTDGSLVIENGSLTEFLDIAMKNITVIIHHFCLHKAPIFALSKKCLARIENM